VTKQNTNQPLSKILGQLNAILRGWTNYHKHGAASATFQLPPPLQYVAGGSLASPSASRANWKQLRRRYLEPEWWPKEGEVMLFDPSTVAITRYRYRAANIPTPWSTETTEPHSST